MQQSASRGLVGLGIGGSAGALVGWVSAGCGAAAVLAAAAAWAGWLAVRSGPQGEDVAASRRAAGSWPAALRGNWAAVVAAACVVAAMVRAHGDPGVSSWPYLIMIIGGPAAALLLAGSAAGMRGRVARTLAAAAVGATVVVVLALVLYSLVGSIGVGLAAPPIAALLRTLESLAGGFVALDLLTTRGAASLLAFTVVVAPIVEEIVKPIGGIAVYPRTRAEAFVFGAASGAGFAVAESFVAAWTTVPFDWLPVLATRSVSAAIPVLGAGIMGLALHDRQHPGDGLSLPRALGLAGLLHAAWNGVLTVAGLAAEPLSAFAPARPLDPALGLVSSLLLAGCATLAIWAIVRVGHGARSPVPVPLLGLRRGAPVRRSSALGWVALGAAVLIPITWGAGSAYL